MIDAGVFAEDERLELLEGMIVEMSPQNPRHAFVIRRLCDARFVSPGPGCMVQCQLPLTLGSDSESEPDVAVVSRAAGGDRSAHPATALLVFEVAGESLRRDRLVKAALYAAARIPEYVIVNLLEDCLEVHRDPDASARRYRTVTTLAAQDRFESSAAPGFSFSVADLLS